MKTRTLFLFLAFAVMAPVATNAQVGNLIKNKLNRVVRAGARTADKEVDNKIDTAVTKEADKQREEAAAREQENRQKEGQPAQAKENQSDDKSSQGQSGGGFGKLFGNKIDLKYNEQYSFTSRIYMVTEVYDKKDVTKMDFFMYYSSQSPSVGVETSSISNEKGDATPMNATMVMDGDNRCMLALTDVNGTKMGIISEIPDENAAQTEGDGKKSKKSSPPTFTKTGNTREIAGYKCDEYTYVSEDKTSGKVWFTKDANLKIDRRGWKNSSMSVYYGNPEFSDGIILANEAYDDKGKLSSKSETREINPDFPHTISVNGYTLRQMNMNQKK